MSSVYLKIEAMGEPTEIELSREHAVLEYALAVTVLEKGTDKILSENTEIIQVGWKRGGEPYLVWFKSDAAMHFLQSEEVLEDLKEAVRYQRDLLKDMN